VIPALLAVPNTLMIGKILWDEFFNNRDWPVASAVGDGHAGAVAGADHDLPSLRVQGTGEQADMSQRAGLSPLLKTMLVFGFVFLYAPILSLVIYSFNESKLVTVWSGFSFKWYGELFRDEGIMKAAWVSIRIAFFTATASVVLATIASVVMTRMRSFRGKTLFGGLITAPLVMPEVITGLSILLLFVSMGMDRGMTTIWIAHVTFCMAFVTVVVSSRLSELDKSIEEAAMDLGANRVKVFFLITCRSSCRRSFPVGCWRSPCPSTTSWSPASCRGRPPRHCR